MRNVAISPQGIGIYVYVPSYTRWILSLRIIIVCIYIYIYVCMSYNWLKITRLRAVEAVRRAGGNLYGIAVSIVRLQLQFV